MRREWSWRMIAIRCSHRQTACFVSLSFAGLVVLARSLNPIPSRTRPLNSSAPMVLWLKPWESRSLPGLPRTKQFLFTCHDRTKRRLPFGKAAFFCAWCSGFGDRRRAIFGHDWPPACRIQSSSFMPVHFKIRTQSCPRFQTVPNPRRLPMREFVRPAAAALSIACLAASMAIVSDRQCLGAGQAADGAGSGRAAAGRRR